MTNTERGFLWLSFVMRNWKMFNCSHWLIIDVVDFSASNWDFFKAFKVLVNWTDLLTAKRASGDIDWHWTLLDIGHCPLTLEMDFVRFCELSYCWLSLAFDGMEEERPSSVFFLQKVKHVLISKMGERLEDHTEWKFLWENHLYF